MSAISPEILFQELQGQDSSGFAVIDSPVYASPGGTSYLVKPGVVVLARPTVNLQGIAGFLDGFDETLHFSEYLDDPTRLPDGAQLCKIAGQVCYMSFGPKRTFNAQATRYFDNLKSSGHGSVFEHANFSLLLYGISRSVTHEVVRHRAGFSYSQLSQRFVSGRMLRFVERPEYCDDEQFHTQFLERIERASSEYAALSNRLLEMQQAGTKILSAEAKTDLRKKVQQCARSVLPNETEAPIVVTGNGRSWRHFIEMRASAHAEIETVVPAVLGTLKLTPLDDLKVVLIGQDPYHGDAQAHGLCFSVRPGIKPPPSLVNIFKELKHDLGCRIPNNGCLIPWADQGMLLLNAVLTVRAGEPNSHRGKGWEKFTDAAIAAVSAKDEPVVFVLWGGPAQKKLALIDASRHTVLKAPHPSPLSAKTGFFGSRPFSKVNAALEGFGRKPIDWRLPAVAHEEPPPG